MYVYIYKESRGRLKKEKYKKEGVWKGDRNLGSALSLDEYVEDVQCTFVNLPLNTTTYIYIFKKSQEL